MMRACIAAVLIISSVSVSGLAADDPAPLPDGPGLAAQYATGQGLAEDPDVVFVEDFEAATFEDVAEKWESVSHPEIMSLTSDVPEGTPGKKSLLMAHVGGKGEGGHLYRQIPPHDQLFVRFYVKFAPDCAPNHHFFHIGGYNPPTAWPQGGAGTRPEGDERITVGIEPFGDAWVWDYYAYWMEMRGSPPRGQTWGNSFIRNPDLKVHRGEWTCMEAMIKLNDVGKRNGELAMWIDGQRVSHLGEGFPKGKWIYDKFIPGEGGDSVRWNDGKKAPDYFSVADGGEPFEGFQFRKSKELKLNFLWILYYMTDIPEGHVSKVWFDDVVVARRYIGPHAERR